MSGFCDKITRTNENIKKKITVGGSRFFSIFYIYCIQLLIEDGLDWYIASDIY